ncbi:MULTISPECIES: hypothetical protein [Burkholderia]|uniref:hypothetical protein n=1 Tax=Burkholderia TaxID=32008 RepID=UPI00114CA612|nr:MULTISPECIES: hypothetical protein [Burkholderia]MBJ9657038.1 hypothetical protein [Burkholderia multivorans]MBJ9683766.1 hypothetical protein [Burkholderia multivorans]MBU9474544.1 hypothetical protein [Burkholderia multivorans]
MDSNNQAFRAQPRLEVAPFTPLAVQPAVISNNHALWRFSQQNRSSDKSLARIALPLVIRIHMPRNHVTTIVRVTPAVSLNNSPRHIASLRGDKSIVSHQTPQQARMPQKQKP